MTLPMSLHGSGCYIHSGSFVCTCWQSSTGGILLTLVMPGQKLAVRGTFTWVPVLSAYPVFCTIFKSLQQHELIFICSACANGWFQETSGTWISISGLIDKLGFTLLGPVRSLNSCSLPRVGGRLLQRHVLPAGQHRRLQLRGVRRLQQHATAPQPAPPRRPISHAGARRRGSGQHGGRVCLCGHRLSCGPGKNKATDANAAIHQR